MRTKDTLPVLLAAAGVIAVAPVRAPSEAPLATAAHEAAATQDAATRADQAPSLMGEVIFPHDEHSDEFELDCEECHHETNAAPLEFPHPQMFDDFWVDCEICHHPAGSADLEPQSCAHCHHSSNGNAADETLSAKVVIHQLCWKCHEVGVGVEASEGCENCHTGP